jgi:hypothetical protein
MERARDGKSDVRCAPDQPESGVFDVPTVRSLRNLNGGEGKIHARLRLCTGWWQRRMTGQDYRRPPLQEGLDFHVCAHANAGVLADEVGVGQQLWQWEGEGHVWKKTLGRERKARL